MYDQWKTDLMMGDVTKSMYSNGDSSVKEYKLEAGQKTIAIETYMRRNGYQ